ncbi:leucine-rich repeat domain-containing protein [Sphingobacteriales bacterium UPWRP_1]|nr:hypothetical protein BVG80_15710 [Sphingobacteriales bacterium TSM_CSM]PSJ73846.1 leucine-rich repeat domain-containing protein [Sphingobacteriales bacterium UPWRP_1]
MKYRLLPHIQPFVFYLFLTALFALSACLQEEKKVSPDELKAAMQTEPDSVTYVLRTAESYFLQRDYPKARESYQQLQKQSGSEVYRQYAEQQIALCDEKIKEMPKQPEEKKPEPPTLDWWNGLDNDWKDYFRADVFKGEATQKEVNRIFNEMLLLNLSHKPITNIEPLRPLVRMRAIEIAGTKVNSLEPIAEHKRLWVLRASNTQITDLQPIANLTKLGEVQLAYTPVTSLEPMKNLIDMNYLNVNGTKITNIDALSGMHTMTHLDISDTRVASLEPIKNIGAMEELLCSNTPITSLEPIAKLGLLKMLVINGTRVTSLAPLANLKNLEKLYCKGIPVGREEVMQFMAQHPMCEVISDYN